MNHAPDPRDEMQQFETLFALLGVAFWVWVVLRAFVH